MRKEVPIEELQKRRLFIGTPMYGGQCSGNYTRSTIDLVKMGQRYGVQIGFYYIFNESLITRARNYIVDAFLRTDSTHLMFIDADIGFDARDVIAMAALASDDSDYDIICGPYPKKTIAWEKIRTAVNKGKADEDAMMLEEYVGDYVFNPVPGTKTISMSEPVEVLEGGTGFMLIRRQVFEKWNEEYKEQLYLPDHIRSGEFDGSREIMCYFDALIDPESRRYLSEDYMFCQWSRAVGLKVWLCPWMRLQHIGSYVFGGSLKALAGIGASPTLDSSQLKKNMAVAPGDGPKTRVWKK